MHVYPLIMNLQAKDEEEEKKEEDIFIDIFSCLLSLTICRNEDGRIRAMPAGMILGADSSGNVLVGVMYVYEGGAEKFIG